MGMDMGVGVDEVRSVWRLINLFAELIFARPSQWHEGSSIRIRKRASLIISPLGTSVCVTPNRK